MNRKEIADCVLKKLEGHKSELSEFYNASNSIISYFFIDDVLPSALLEQANAVFPPKSDCSLKKSLKEKKYVSAQMNTHHPILEEILFAFQDVRVVKCIQDICGIESLIEPDANLYAGGLSLMNKGCFLNPHLDNSHDAKRSRWRALNLLLYVSPDWELKYGGNLELWPEGVNGSSIEILSKFNRLVVMETHDASWHSVNEIAVNKERKCISNYYFSPTPLTMHKGFHVTTFKGRPNQKLRSAILKADSKLRMGILKFFKKGIRKNPHIYKK